MVTKTMAHAGRSMAGTNAARAITVARRDRPAVATTSAATRGTSATRRTRMMITISAEMMTTMVATLSTSGSARRTGITSKHVVTRGRLDSASTLALFLPPFTTLSDWIAA
ncbi:hypothetical protein RSOLAG1IB_11283 [Rhizoctonia solani AG-1 IB]|uniref:Uncharacterized protein n=1 Tax=Thanatephorus cucumeris (strain AG1-IB / isolate 7/3/14) TaxID=1108050 RepID=A0A0B7F525_THACB|nr:hypothetical protein RSOLAG1IB_11283 [Rhizoctonia solani AG-1 IB]